MDTINLADAKARLSELVERAAAGETIEISRRGKRVARLTSATPGRAPIDFAALEALTKKMPWCSESAADLVRRMRDEARY